MKINFYTRGSRCIPSKRRILVYFNNDLCKYNYCSPSITNGKVILHFHNGIKTGNCLKVSKHHKIHGVTNETGSRIILAQLKWLGYYVKNKSSKDIDVMIKIVDTDSITIEFDLPLLDLQ